MVYLFLGFKLKDFLRENETLSTFLQQNASFSQTFVKNILEADVNLEKVSIILKGKKSINVTMTIEVHPFLTCSS